MHSISVIVPARNEAANLPRLFRSLRNQKLEPQEIILVDDQSSDGTGRIAKNEGALVVEGGKRPEGWLGKPWACWQGAKRAKGEVLVFLDADTFLESDGLSCIVGTYLERGGLVSIWPYHRMDKLYERLAAFFNIIVMACMGVFTPLGGRIKPSGAFGPCLVCSRDDYFRVGGHEAARGSVLDDVSFGKLFLEAGRKVRLFGGRKSIAFRMYQGGIGALIQGFSKNMGAGALTIRGSMLFLIICWIAGTFIVTFYSIQSLVILDMSSFLVWFIINLAYVLQLYWILYRLGNYGLFTAAFYQMPLFFFTAVFFLSLVQTFLFRRVYWKGRKIKLAGRQ
jgi:4,4'-diaponeurosporenoate glycosyltransferase